jgi:outer membrane protein assembly factor BamD (BamD/ComL family)
MLRIFFYALLLFSVMSTAQCQTLKNNEGMDKKHADKYQEAQKEARKGNYNESVKLYHEVLKKYPEKVEAWLKLASVQYNQKNYTSCRKKNDKRKMKRARSKLTDS